MKTRFLILIVLMFSGGFAMVDANASITFDKNAYTWTDKINLRVTEHGIDASGTSVKIYTSDHALNNYKLSKAGNGLYTGEIILTGFPRDVTGDGQSDTNPRTSGNGPNDGFLQSMGDDLFTVSIRFGDGDEIRKSVKIKWNMGDIVFDRIFSAYNESVHIKVIDADMNLNPETLDKIPIHVFSDSDKAGLVVDAIETQKESGIFETFVSISSHSASGGGNLFAQHDDVVYAQYDDYTLPEPYRTNDDLAITAELVLFPLEELGDKKIEWSQGNYAVKNGTGTAKIIVNDSDKNTFADSIDTLQVFVFSDSFREGIEIDLYETEKDTGIFERTFSFSDKRSAPSILYALEGDTVTARYAPGLSLNSENISMISTMFLGLTGPPLERAPVQSAKIINVFGNTINNPTVGEQVQIVSDIENGMNRPQKFAYLVMIQDVNGATEHLAWIDGTLNPDSAFSPSASWIPTKEGDYTATMFVWESVENPTALSPPIQIEFSVVKENSEKVTSDTVLSKCMGDELCLSETIMRIVDGDTLYLKGGYEVRLSLTNTPERYERGFYDASQFTAKMCPVAMTAVFDQDDEQPYDMYGRLLGKITCDDKVLNSELLYAGHANILKQYCSTSEFSDESWAQEFGCK